MFILEYQLLQYLSLYSNTINVLENFDLEKIQN